MIEKLLRIGTRDSLLAQWQSNHAAQLLSKHRTNCNLVFIKSEGDINLTTPLYEMGVQGIFTKALETALLDNKIDIAVHSYKDVPTKLADGLQIAAVLKRENPGDLLVCSDEFSYKHLTEKFINSNTETISHDREQIIIATSSIRRKAQWLHHLPNTTIENLRGNVNTRLQKLHQSNWNGAIFATAGLQRLNITPPFSMPLNWMLPAPAQGAIVILCRKNDTATAAICSLLNDFDTQVCTQCERDFLRALMGGCSTPIAALASIINNDIHFKGNILSADGSQIINIAITLPVKDYEQAGKIAAAKIVEKGAAKIIQGFSTGATVHV
jgi:hydroxymethylbilane synthase